MHKSREVLHSVGNFFGITNDMQKWREKAERQIHEKDFGIHMRRASLKRDRSREKFFSDAEKMLSRIDLFQKIEDEKDRMDSGASDVDERPVNIISDSEHDASMGKSGMRWIENETYEEDFEQKLETSAIEMDVKFKQENDMTLQEVAVGENEADNCEDNAIIYFDEMVGESDPAEVSEITAEVIAEEELKLDDKSDQEQKVTRIFTTAMIHDSLPTSTDKKSDAKACNEMHMEEKKSCDKTDKTECSNEATEQDCAKKNSDEAVKFDSESGTGGSRGKHQITRAEKRRVSWQDNNRGKPGKKAETLRKEDLVYGKEALRHYQLFTVIEKNVEEKKLTHALQTTLSEYDWKIQAVDELISFAKDYYTNPQTKKAGQWKQLKRNVKNSCHHIGRTEVRRKLGSLTEYKPYFTYLIIMAQVISFIVICALSGFADSGLEPKLTIETDLQTFMGMETVHKWIVPNVWIGPSYKALIGYGAFYAPCIRNDIGIQVLYSQAGYSVDAVLGCCEVAARNVAGTTTEEECDLLTHGVGEWRARVTCHNRPVTESHVRHVLLPCCIGVKGQCRLLTHKHCMFYKGVFFQHGPEHCSQVNCLGGLCKPGHLEGTVDQPWLPDSPNQWWRVGLSLLYHHGIIELAIVVMAQLLLFIPVEHLAGWLRMAVIYVLSGTASLLISASFTPYQPHVGGIGAVCGMIGVVLVELLQFWSIVQSPGKELVKILVVIALLLFCGTLPYLNIFGMVAGIIVGMLCGVIVLPYITFGDWGAHARIVLVSIALLLLFGFYYLSFHLCVQVQSLDTCAVCTFMDCISYTEKMCDKTLWEE